jgi:signal transduction histidine kinase
MPDCTTRGPDAPALQHELAEALATLAALRQEQQVFAYGISHDLRAPLRSIDRFAALLEQATTLDESDRAHLARIRTAAGRMGGLIDALLELSHVNRAELHPTDVDLGLLAGWALAELQEAEPARRAQVEIAPDLRAHGDERLLRLLLRQLLDNAWKFSRGCAETRIRVRGTRVGDRVRIEIEDAGVGFDLRYAHKLFAPFQRLHGADEGGGSGIGLVIAQRIVARHGGRIGADTLPEGGSRFHFDLPAAAGADRSTE